MPQNFSGEIVVMFHGFTGNKIEHACHFRNFSRILEKESIASLRLDFSGNGESDGTFLDFTFDTLIDDASDIIEYVFRLDKIERVNLLGFSMGGAVAAMMASKYCDKINKLLLWSPAANIISIIKRNYESSKKDSCNNTLKGCFSLSKEMYDSLEKHDIFENLSLYNKDVLIIHGKKDLSVPYELSNKYLEVFDRSKIHYIDSAGHGYDENDQSEELYEISKKFILE